ncbi:hypothetical protein P692DRAFT_20215395 [Suillus brevipes Sb2]|nr:hypothetical protein P692DRAFT_20215395 [Suillus brevipes Sb2]
MCILVTDVGTSRNSAHVVEPVLLPIEASSLLVLVPVSLAILSRSSLHQRPVIQPNARGGLRMLITANITASMLLHDFIALNVCRSAILVWLSLVRISYLRFRVIITHVQVDV